MADALDDYLGAIVTFLNDVGTPRAPLSEGAPPGLEGATWIVGADGWSLVKDGRVLAHLVRGRNGAWAASSA